MSLYRNLTNLVAGEKKRKVSATIDSPEEQAEGPIHFEISIPLFIRLMEYARESAKDDLVLHKIAERAEKLLKTKDVLDINDYMALVPEDKEH